MYNILKLFKLLYKLLIDNHRTFFIELYSQSISMVRYTHDSVHIYINKIQTYKLC
jgi:hypothetical protein